MGVVKSDYPQYGGELYLFNDPSTPFLASLGSSGRLVNNFNFALSSSYTLTSGTQPAITEDASIADPSTFISHTRDQDENTCQIHQKFVKVSYKAMSAYNAVIGNSSDYTTLAGENQVTDIFNKEMDMALREMYHDINYTCWNGTYQRAANTATAGKSRGLNAAITTFVYNTGTTMANLTKAKIDAALAERADAGIPLTGNVIFVNSAAKIKISDLYSLTLQNAPRDRNIGGVDVQTLVTDFGMFPIVYDRHVPANKIFVLNMGEINNVWCSVPGKGNLFYEDKPLLGAAKAGMLYGQWGLDYGAEEMHGVINCNG